MSTLPHDDDQVQREPFDFERWINTPEANGEPVHSNPAHDHGLDDVIDVFTRRNDDGPDADLDGDGPGPISLPPDEEWFGFDPTEDDATPDLDLDPTDLTDQSWILGEALQWRGRASLDVLDLPGLVASTIETLARSMSFYRTPAAADYARVRCLRLDAVRLPAGPSRSRSALAVALWTEAAWYLQIDRIAGQVVAHALLFQAALADEMGSANVEDFVIEEAAYQAAAYDAIYGELTRTYAVA